MGGQSVAEVSILSMGRGKRKRGGCPTHKGWKIGEEWRKKGRITPPPGEKKLGNCPRPGKAERLPPGKVNQRGRPWEGGEVGS